MSAGAQGRSTSDREAPRQVAIVMAGVVAREPGAISDLFEIASGPVRGMLVSRFQEAGVWVDRDRLDDIVRNAVLELVRLAPAWRSDGGASPWRWARAQLISQAFLEIGMFVDDLDDHLDVPDRGPAFGDPEVAMVDLLAEMSATCPEAGLLLAALDRVASARDRSVWLDALCEQSAGNRSPSVTVAQSHDLTPAAVRKVCQRVRERLTDLAKVDHEFAGLLALEPLAA